MSNGTTDLGLDWLYALQDIGCIESPTGQCPVGSSPISVTIDGKEHVYCCPDAGQLPPEFPADPGFPGDPSGDIWMVSEQDCRNRETAAKEAGRSEERSKFLFYTIAGTLVGTIVGWAVTKALGDE